MTLVGAMVCNDAIIMGADTQHTDGIVKFHGHKLEIFPYRPRWQEPHERPWPSSPYAVGVGGGGWPAP